MPERRSLFASRSFTFMELARIRGGIHSLWAISYDPAVAQLHEPVNASRNFVLSVAYVNNSSIRVTEQTFNQAQKRRAVREIQTLARLVQQELIGGLDQCARQQNHLLGSG